MHSLILTWASWILALMLPPRHADVAFYSEHVTVEYRPELFANGPLELTEPGISYHYARVTEQDWLPLHTQLESAHRRLKLNDWLYYRLVVNTVDEIAAFAADSERRVLVWHLLTLSGYDTRLCFDNSDLYVYAATDDELFEVPMITDRGHRYVNLTAALNPRHRSQRTLRMHPLRTVSDGKAFGFGLRQLPRLTPSLQERTFRFRHQGELLTVHGLSDRTIAGWMHDYPFFSEGLYVETPLSDLARERLYGELRPMLAGKSDAEALALLASFTRSSFAYKEDKKSFGFSKPMIPDEVLYYPVSDCEDRSALYFTIVRDLLNLPVIAIAYDDHLSVAVASDELVGTPFLHEGRAFYVCDPTGPSGSSSIGEPPYGYADRPFEVVAAYLPEGV